MIHHGRTKPFCRIPPLTEMTEMMIDMTPFRDIIHEWFEQRLCIEVRPWQENNTNDHKIGARHASLIAHLKAVVWQLKQQKKDIELLKHILLFWVQCDQLMERIYSTRELREQLLYNTLEDYLNGQGYPTALPLPTVR